MSSDSPPAHGTPTVAAQSAGSPLIRASMNSASDRLHAQQPSVLRIPVENQSFTLRAGCVTGCWMPATPALAPISLSYHLALIVESLCRAVTVRGAQDRSVPTLVLIFWPGRGCAACPSGSRRWWPRCAPAGSGAPVARLRAPPLPQRYRLPGSGRSRYRLPRGFGWLVRLVPETVAYRGQVEYLLAKPKMTALLAASPQAGASCARSAIC